MKKRIAVRGLVMLLTAALLISSTGIYNLLAYAARDEEGASVSTSQVSSNDTNNSSDRSASKSDDSIQPTIVTEGGKLVLSDQSGSPQVQPNEDGITWLGNGTQADPYQISSLAHFLQVNRMVNGSLSTMSATEKHFILTADIDLSGIDTTATPGDGIKANITSSNINELAGAQSSDGYLITANRTAPGSGTAYIDISGNGYKITGGADGVNVNIDSHENFGIFGYLGTNSVVSDIIFENISVNVSAAQPRSVALVAYRNDGVIENCSFNNVSFHVGATTAHASDNYLYDGGNTTIYVGVAGAVADNRGTVSGCSFTHLNMTFSGNDDYIGAVVAQNRSYVTGCTVNGITITTSNNSQYIGAIAGINKEASTALGIQGCKVNLVGTDTVRPHANSFVGGDNVGGIVGKNDGYVNNSAVIGSVSSAATLGSSNANLSVSITKKNMYFGGITGNNTGVINKCTVVDFGAYLNVAYVDSLNRYPSASAFGGITGTTSVDAANKITNCYASGKSETVGSERVSYAGGIVGRVTASSPVAGSISNCYALMNNANYSGELRGAVVSGGGNAAMLSNCHWSDDVSGCKTSYVETDSDGYITSVDYSTGNTVSGNRAVVVSRGSTQTVNYSTLTHSWGSGSISTPDQNSGFINVNTNAYASNISASSVTVSGIQDNSFGGVIYKTQITLPSGVGADSEVSGLATIPQSFTLDVITATASGDPDTASAPFEISSSAQMALMQRVTYGHFKLMADVSVSDSWHSFAFTGTLDGNSMTVKASAPLFTEILGARTGALGAAFNSTDFTSDPVADSTGNSSYYTSGVVKNLTVDLGNNFAGGVFGTAYNSTLLNINTIVTETKVETANGNDEDGDGINGEIIDAYRGVFTESRRGLFLNAAFGNTYVYGCNLKADMTISSNCIDVASFIGKVVGNTVIDNCLSRSEVYVTANRGTNSGGRSTFIADIGEMTGYIQNSLITGRIYGGASSYVSTSDFLVFGECSMPNDGHVNNVIYTQFEAANLNFSAPNPIGQRLIDWEKRNNAPISVSVPITGEGTVTLTPNSKINAFSEFAALDFEVSARNNDNSENCRIDIASVTARPDGSVVLTLRAANNPVVGADDVSVTVTHTPTGAKAFISVSFYSGMAPNAEGFYEIATPADLMWVSQNQISLDLLGASFMLVANIDMAGYNFTPLGSNDTLGSGVVTPFTGIFTGETNDDGSPKYTISNLTIDPGHPVIDDDRQSIIGQPLTPAYSTAMFACVDLQGGTVLNSTPVDSFIGNFKLENATVAGIDQTGILIGSIFNSDGGTDSVIRVSNIDIINSTIINGIDPMTGLTADADGSKGKIAGAVVASTESSIGTITDVTVNGLTVTSTFAGTPNQYTEDNVGIGGIAGYVSTPGNLTISDFAVSGLDISVGSINVGGVVGNSYDNSGTLVIGGTALKPSTVSGSVLRADCSTGGVIGSAYGATEISYVNVSGTTDPAISPDMSITTGGTWFIGGIAGYSGTSFLSTGSIDSAALASSVNSFIANCNVTKVLISADTDGVESVTAGGIAGAAEGPVGGAIADCAVTDSVIHAITAGGIAGSSTVANETMLCISGCNVNNCDISGSGTAEASLSYYMNGVVGVGGILGTNSTELIADFHGNNLASSNNMAKIEDCVVDAATTVSNDSDFYAYTGGIVGQLFNAYSDTWYSSIFRCESYAEINSDRVFNSVATPNGLNETNNYGTGGIIGHLGYIGSNLFDYLQMRYCIFGGSVNAHSMAGGLIGSVGEGGSTIYCDFTYSLITDCAVSGSVNVTDTTTTTVGSIIGSVNTWNIFSSYLYTQGNLEPYFNNIYVSSFTNNMFKFGDEYGSMLDDPANGFLCAAETYVDVNENDSVSGNGAGTRQFEDYTESGSLGPIDDSMAPVGTNLTDTSPIATRDSSDSSIYIGGYVSAYSFNLAETDVWNSYNEGIVTLTYDGNGMLLLNPLNVGTTGVYTTYYSNMTDGENWNVDVALRAGFMVESAASEDLAVGTDGVNTFYVIEDKYDLVQLWSGNFADYDQFAIVNDIEFSPADFSGTTAIWKGGILPLDMTQQVEFTAHLFSADIVSGDAENGYTCTLNDAYHTVSNVQIKVQPVDGAQIFGLFSNVGDGASFENFGINNITVKNSTTTECYYIGALAGYADGSVTVNNVNVSDSSLSGALYVGGLFGGFGSSGVKTVENSSFTGTKLGNSYSSDITAQKMAAGIVADSGVYSAYDSATFTDVRVSGTKITQSRPIDTNLYSTTDEQAYFEAFNFGAAGICVALSSSVNSAQGGSGNSVENCYIKGEIAAGAVCYASDSAEAYDVELNNISVNGSYVEATVAPTTGGNMTDGYNNGGAAGAAGILQRANQAMSYNIQSCSVDSASTVVAKEGVGGIVGLTNDWGEASDGTIYNENKWLTMSITGCESYGTLKATNSVNSILHDQQGVGAIIGVIAPLTELVGINVKKCVAGGTLISDYSVGGIIGSIKTGETLGDGNYDLSTDTDHFIESCVVSADFKLADGSELFGASGSRYSGLILGDVYGSYAATSASPLPATAYTAGCEPIYNVYYSSQNYSAVMSAITLFGDSGSGSSLNSESYYSTGVINCLANTVYDINTLTDFHGENADATGDMRLSWTNNKGQLKDTIEIESDVVCGEFAPGRVIDGALVNDPAVGANENFALAASPTPSVMSFALHDDNAGDNSTDLGFDVVNVSSPDERITITNNAGAFTLTSSSPNVSTMLVFEYSNGIEMSIYLRVVSQLDHYWFKSDGENGTGTRTDYLVWSHKETGAFNEDDHATADYLLMYDIWMALSPADVVVANADVNGKTLGDVYSDGLITSLADYWCPNPNYSASLAASIPGYNVPMFVSFDTYFSTDGSLEARKALSLAAVIEIDTFAAGDYNDYDISNFYTDNTAFTGSFTSAQRKTDSSYFKIYNYRSKVVNESASGTDLDRAGLFTSLGAGASVSHIELVNPEITVVNSKNVDNYAGALAGQATNAVISDVTVTGGFVKSIRLRTPAQTYVGGIVGSLVDSTPNDENANASITNCSVSGMNIVGSVKAQGISTAAADFKYIYVGGIAGSSVGSITASSVTSCNIASERNTDSDYFYLSYVGGVAGAARGTISNIAVTGTDLSGCTVNASSAEYPITFEATGRRADRVGGIAALADVSLTVENCSFIGSATGGSIKAYDTAGGVVAILNVSTATSLTIDNCTVGGSGNTHVTVTVYSSSIVITAANIARKRYDTAGGAVGYAPSNLTALTINDVDINAYIGSYSYQNEYDTIAGGVLGTIPDNGSIDNIHITLCTVQGEVVGFRCVTPSSYRNRGESDTGKHFAGAAGGIVGKIYTYNYKSYDTEFVSQCSMAASVAVYTDATGSKRDDTDTEADSYVGKIFGEVRYGAGQAQNFAGRNEDLIDYVNNVYISSYPYTTEAFGSASFYSSQSATPYYNTYFDINKQTVYVEESTTDEYGNTTTTAVEREMGSLLVDNSEYQSYPGYANGVYSEVAILPYDSEVGTTQGDRMFRLANYGLSMSGDGVTKTIGFDNNFALISDTPGNFTATLLSSPAVGSFSETVNSQTYNYTAGVVSISADAECIGSLVADYSYGLQTSTIFISQEIEGTGTQLDPFQIINIRQLSIVRALPDKYYEQKADLNFANPASFGGVSYPYYVAEALYADSGFEPIGTAAKPFTGFYDGEGHTVTGLWINRPTSENIGFFGVIGGSSIISNLHIELLENGAFEAGVAGGILGGNNVGGLAGWVRGEASILNCSVAYSSVTGNMKVGGLVGYSSATSGATEYQSCFASTDVNSYMNSETVSVLMKSVGGLIGNIGASSEIVGCFTTGFVNAPFGAGVAGGLVGSTSDGTTVYIDDCFVGATVSAQGGNVNGSVSTVGITVGAAGGNVRVARVIVAATRAVFDDNAHVAKALLGSGTPFSGSANNYYDIDALGSLAAEASVSPKTAANLTGGTNPGNLNTTSTGMWTLNSGLYPRLRLVIVSGTRLTDSYFDDFAEIAAIPLTVDVTSEQLDNNRFDGIFYPVSFIKNKGSGNDYAYSSSVIDASDTVPYPETLDESLVGNGTNKSVDLLFENYSDNTVNKVRVFRNIFGSETSATFKTDGSLYDNNTIYYSHALPRVYVTYNSGERTVSRSFVLPLENRSNGIGGTYYPISTARQLNALSNYSESVSDTKFYNHYNNKNNSYLLVCDLDLKDIDFEPIVGYQGLFNGNHHKIKNLSIDKSLSDNTEVGMFRTIEAGEIRNLTLENAKIKGQNSVGALVGAILPADCSGANSSFNTRVVIDNCHVTATDADSGVTATGYFVGGLVGAAVRSSNQSNYGIFNCTSSIDVTGKNVVGGLVGYSEIKIENSYSTGAVNATLTNDTANRVITPWVATPGNLPTCATSVANTNANAKNKMGVGGLVGVVCSDTSSGNYANASVGSCFSSGAVTITSAESVSVASATSFGVGGLAGILGADVDANTCFSNGNVFYCYQEENPQSLSGSANSTVGIGGLIGISFSLTNLYSCSSVAANFGNLAGSGAIAGVGGVVGVAKGTVNNVYSSGSTLSETGTVAASGVNYGCGGAIGVFNALGSSCANAYYDNWISATANAVGKNVAGSVSGTTCVGYSTRYFTTLEGAEGQSDNEILGSNFGYVTGAYPYIKTFFHNDVSLDIRVNALLSIYAIQPNELDTSAENQLGISMALDIPLGIDYTGSYSGADQPDSDNIGYYAYGSTTTSTNGSDNFATAIIDSDTSTLSIQRTTNNFEQVNIVVSVSSKDGATADSNGRVYADVAQRVVSRTCAQMRGTEELPYLISTENDFSHIGQLSSSLSGASPDYYDKWVTPLDAGFNPVQGKVHFRLMGYVTLNNPNTTIPDLTTQVYNGIAYRGIEFNGIGYSVRGLSNAMFAKHDAMSNIKNVTFDNVSFDGGDALVTENLGTIEKAVIKGSATGTYTAGIAGQNSAGGIIDSCVANITYTSAGAVQTYGGIVGTNNGTITKSASVGNITAKGANETGGFAAINNGTISECFTIGNIDLNTDTSALSNKVGGFVGENRSGTISDCYTRCNIFANGGSASSVVGSFAGVNSGAISESYSAGRFDLGGVTRTQTAVFAGSGAGTLTSCVFDKQQAGSSTSEIFRNAARSKDIMSLEDYPAMTEKFAVVTPTGNSDLFYPQLASIKTGTYSTELNELGETVETIDSRATRVLRAYSFISSVAAVVPNDQYIDTIPNNGVVPLSFNSTTANDIWSITDAGSSSSTYGFFGTGGNDVTGRKLTASGGAATISARAKITDFYGRETQNGATLDIFTSTGTNPNFAGGSGTSVSPFQIANAQQFVALSYYGTNADNHFIVNNDIDMTDASWNAYITAFAGHLNGNGKAIMNVTIPAGESNGLFGNLEAGSEIADTGVTGINVTATSNNAGLFAASAEAASVTGCYAIGTLTATGSVSNVGGFIGSANGTTIDGCITSGRVIANDASDVGGIVGKADAANISNCFSSSSVTGASNVGGIIGSVTNENETETSVTNAIFANATYETGAGEPRNIIASGRNNAAVANDYFDNQFASISFDGDGTAASTYYLTGTATAAGLGFTDAGNDLWGKFEGSADSYFIPNVFLDASHSANFKTGVRFATLKISLSSGAGSGNINAFTTFSAPATVNGNAARLIPGSVTYFDAANSGTMLNYNTDASTIRLNQQVTSSMSYSLYDGVSSPIFDGGKMLRYFDLSISKTLKLLYNFVDAGARLGASETANVLVSNPSGAITTFVSAFTLGSNRSGTLTDNMVVSYDEASGCYSFKVDSRMPSGDIIDNVSLTVKDSGGNTVAYTPTITSDNGGFTVQLDDGTQSALQIGEIIINLNVAERPTVWGIIKSYTGFH